MNVPEGVHCILVESHQFHHSLKNIWVSTIYHVLSKVLGREGQTPPTKTTQAELSWVEIRDKWVNSKQRCKALLFLTPHLTVLLNFEIRLSLCFFFFSLLVPPASGGSRGPCLYFPLGWHGLFSLPQTPIDLSDLSCQVLPCASITKHPHGTMSCFCGRVCPPPPGLWTL